MMGAFEFLSVVAPPVVGVANSIIGSHSNADVNKKTREWQAEQNTLAYERQKELTQLSPGLQKQGLIQAGISPAAMNGYTGGTASINSANSAPSPQSEYVPFDVSSMFSAYLAAKQAESIDANTEKTRQEAKSLALDNRAKESTQNAWNIASSEGYFVDENGKEHRPDDPNFTQWMDDYIKTHGGTPDFVKPSGVYSEDAARVPAAMANFRAQIAQSGMYESQAKLAKKISELKLADSDVMGALYRMDLAQYNQLMAAVAKTNSDIDVNATIKALNNAKTEEAKQSILESIARTALYGAEKGQIENSSVNNLIDQLGGDKSLSQNLITVGKILVAILSGAADKFSVTKLLK